MIFLKGLATILSVAAVIIVVPLAFVLVVVETIDLVSYISKTNPEKEHDGNERKHNHDG